VALRHGAVACLGPKRLRDKRRLVPARRVVEVVHRRLHVDVAPFIPRVRVPLAQKSQHLLALSTRPERF
jgi:hypothetical protein